MQQQTRLAPADAEIREMPPVAIATGKQEENAVASAMSPSQRIENARVVTLGLAALGGSYIAIHFSNGGGLNLNTINMIFLVLGLALADSPKHYLQLLGNAGRVIAPFLVQYPLYAGIMGIIAVSGLGELLVNGFVAISDANSSAS